MGNLVFQDTVVIAFLLSSEMNWIDEAIISRISVGVKLLIDALCQFRHGFAQHVQGFPVAQFDCTV